LNEQYDPKTLTGTHLGVTDHNKAENLLKHSTPPEFPSPILS